MIYRNDDVPYAFFHVPRTSGTNIGHYLETRCGGRVCLNTCTPAVHHSVYASEVKHKDLSNFYKFGFVRNPYSRDYSLFTLYHQSPGTEKMEFKDWIIKRYSSYDDHDAQNFRLPQYGYYCDESGTLQVNVFRYEERELALQHIADIIKTDPIKLIENRPDYSESDFRYNHVVRGVEYRDYRSLYDNELYDFVTPFYQTDLDAFGYTFDGSKAPIEVEFTHTGHPDFYNYDYTNPETIQAPYLNI